VPWRDIEVNLLFPIPPPPPPDLITLPRLKVVDPDILELSGIAIEVMTERLQRRGVAEREIWQRSAEH